MSGAGVLHAARYKMMITAVCVIGESEWDCPTRLAKIMSSFRRQVQHTEKSDSDFQRVAGRWASKSDHEERKNVCFDKTEQKSSRGNIEVGLLWEPFVREKSFILYAIVSSAV